ncbi:MAG: hypothetical protein ACJAYG_000032 [Oceanicoccus sp.]|jgi:hypothetical protein
MKTTMTTLPIALLAVIVGGCSGIDDTSAQPTISPGLLAILGPAVKQIESYSLNGWNYINPQALIINSSPNRDYLVTLRNRCHELSNQKIIGTTATGTAMHANFGNADWHRPNP